MNGLRYRTPPKNYGSRRTLINLHPHKLKTKLFPEAFGVASESLAAALSPCTLGPSWLASVGLELQRLGDPQTVPEALHCSGFRAHEICILHRRGVVACIVGVLTECSCKVGSRCDVPGAPCSDWGTSKHRILAALPNQSSFFAAARSRRSCYKPVNPNLKCTV